jgi:hypothetical protein
MGKQLAPIRKGLLEIRHGHQVPVGRQGGLKRCPNWRSNTAAAANGNSQQPSRERQWPRGRTARSCAWVTASNGSSN